MSMVDWLLTEQLVAIFREARTKRPTLNAELLASSPHAEEELLAGAGTAVQIRARNDVCLLVTPKRITRLVGEDSVDLIRFDDLIGYDWISPRMEEKVKLKDAHWDRLYLHHRTRPAIILDELGDAVYPLMTFLGKVLELRSEKVLLRNLDDEVVDILGRCLAAMARGPFFEDEELPRLFNRNREALDVVAALWPHLNLAAPELEQLLERGAAELVDRRARDEAAWIDWVNVEPDRLRASVQAFSTVVGGTTT